MKRWFSLSVIFFVVAIVVGAAYLGLRSATEPENEAATPPVTVSVTRGDVQQTVTAPGQLVGTQEVLLGLHVAGHLADIRVRPGSVVQTGQVLAQLDLVPLVEALEQAQLRLDLAQAEHTHQLAQARLKLRIAQARLQQAQTHRPDMAEPQAELAAAQAERQQLLDGPSQDEITIAAVELRQSQIALEQAQWAYDQVAYADNIGALPEAAALEAATLDYETKQAKYNLATRDPTEADIANMQARVQQAQAQLNFAQAEMEANRHQLAILEAEVEQARLALEQLQGGIDPFLIKTVEEAERDLANASLTAPFDGVVLELLAKPGAYLTAESPLLLLAAPAAVEVQVKVIEEDLPLVQVGQPVDIFFDAYPAEAIQGNVTRIVPQRIQNEERPLYHVYITPIQLPPQVVSGMTADVSVIVAQRANVLRLPRALVRANTEGTAQVKVWTGGQIETRAVQVGLRGDVYVEIIAGLSESTQVVGE